MAGENDMKPVYEAYSLLGRHQKRAKIKCSAPAILVVGHQTDGKSGAVLINLFPTQNWNCSAICVQYSCTSLHPLIGRGPFTVPAVRLACAPLLFNPFIFFIDEASPKIGPGTPSWDPYIVQQFSSGRGAVMFARFDVRTL